MLASKLVFLNELPKNPSRLVSDPSLSLVIFDRRLLKVSPEFRSWIAKFPCRYGVTSGEALKDIRNFPSHAIRLASLVCHLSPRDLHVVAIGGGTVGDFAGFFASTFKRGVSLVHVPTTWLSAIDSSHGGKTALNSKNIKNQFGSFYPASRVVLIRSLLFCQPESRVQDAMGELAKIALLDYGKWVRLIKPGLRGENLLWQNLRHAILAKMKVVKRDPLEREGTRQILNLGHTVGHALESAYRWSHGCAVAQGLFFSLEYSRHRGLLSDRDHQQIKNWLWQVFGLSLEMPQRKLRLDQFKRILNHDKKRTGKDRVVFIFVKKPGRVARIKVPVNDLVTEARRQGWIV